jgi:multidrug efflux pump subunit AcrA (membrane-fusion protein)
MRRMRILALAIALPVLVLAGYLGLRSGGAGARAPEATPTPVTVAVTRGEVSQTVLAPGQLVGTREALLSAPDGGLVDEIAVRPGSQVERGGVVARMGGGQKPVLAPFAGTIAQVMALPGQNLAPGQGLALLVDPTALEVRATVIEEDLPLVRLGQAAALYFDALPDVTASGRVARIVPYRVQGEDRPLYDIFVSLDSPQPALVSGMTTDAEITVAAVGNALRLPRGVLRQGTGDGARVKVWAAGQVQERTVRLGLRGKSYVEILDGLKEGDEVIGE